MEESLPVVVSNTLTVLLSALGLFAIWRMLARMDREAGYLGAFGCALIVGGGASATLNRLAVNLGGAPVRFFPDNFFSLLAPGFICLTYAVWHGQRVMLHQPRPQSVWFAPIGLIGASQGLTAWLVGLPGGPTAFVVLLTTATLANMALNWLCIRQALRQGRPVVALLFAGYTGMILSLNAVAHLGAVGSPLTLALIQSLNVLAAAFFARGAWLLNLQTRRILLLRQQLAGLAG
ncbi:MAG TPA: hypothetical protein VD886_06380 [Herpetosiphonaceae bacterium]|nr:hypothetical protein [Herpetosiphonaceae bacterium]